jgi:lysozyme
MATDQPRSRTKVAALVLSASTLVGIAVNEGYRQTAYMPTPQDRPTLGYGETKGVHMGDKTTPDRALVQLLASAQQHADEIKPCIHVPMYQYEWESAVDISYNIGSHAFCTSTMVRKLNAGDYQGFCDGMLAWNKQAGHVLPGLTKRREQERRHCLGQS